MLHSKQKARELCRMKLNGSPILNLRCKIINEEGSRHLLLKFTVFIQVILRASREIHWLHHFIVTHVHILPVEHAFLQRLGMKSQDATFYALLQNICNHFSELDNNSSMLFAVMSCFQCLTPIWYNYVVNVRVWVQRVSFLVQNSIKSLVGNVFILFK